MNTQFLLLPGEVFASVWSFVGDLRALAKVDIAFACKQQRPLLAATVYQKSIVHTVSRRIITHSGIPKKKYHTSFLSWVISRQCAVDGLYITAELEANPDLRVKFLEVTGHALQWIFYPTYFDPSQMEQTIADLEKYCPNIEVLHIGTTVTHKGLTKAGNSRFHKAVAAICGNLTHLDLTDSSIDSADFEGMVKACRRLTMLRYASGTVSPKGSALLEIALPSLVHLELGSAGTDALAIEIGRRCPLLEHLCIFGSGQVTDVGARAIAEGCRKLHTLNLLFARGLSTDTLVTIFTNCPLRSTFLRFYPALNDDLLTTLMSVCPTLEEMSLYECAITDAVFTFMLSAGMNLCPNLRKLELYACRRLSDAGVCAAMLAFPMLSALHLSSFPQLTNEVLHTAANVCGPRLTEFSLSDGVQLTDAGVISLAAGCPNLQVVNFCSCQRLGDAAVTALALQCPKLRSLCVSECYAVTVRGVQTLADNAKALEELRVCKDLQEERDLPGFPGGVDLWFE